MSTNAQNVARQAFAAAAPRPDRTDTAIKIREVLAAREQKLEEHKTRTYVDKPIAVTVGPDGATTVAMESGRVWRSAGGHWQAVGAGPLPDSTARETFDELMGLNRELKELGHVESEV